MKKILVFTAILSSLVVSQNSLADDATEVKLKKKCTKEYPLVQGETDQVLLGTYAQICETKKADEKSVLLIQAAQRYQQIGQSLKALQLVNELRSQNIESTSLTDVQFLAGSSIANAAISQMRTKELRYLTADETYPVAKTLTDSINAAKPATVLVEKVSVADDEPKATVKNTARYHKAKAPQKVTRTPAKPKQTTTVAPAKPKPVAPAKASGGNPFAGL